MSELSKKKILFLYTELAGYSLACFNELVNNGVQLHVIHYQVNKEAPFAFPERQSARFYSREKYDALSLETLIRDINPDMIICSGWIDKDYLALCKNYFKKIPTVVAFDNQWKGTLKQRAAVLASSKILLNKFSHCWVPGDRQVAFAKKLGFKSSNILKNLYSADLDLFENIFTETKEIKKQKFPHRFIYSGRYYDFKGITDLWQAFSELQNEKPNDWELWCLGTGTIQPVIHEKIKHFGFVQPNEMKSYLEQTGVFVLASRKEPWGVSVQEFAAAGFPLLLSNEVGSGDVFLKENKNGFLFESGNIADLKQKMESIISLSNSELIEMAHHSNMLSKQISPQIWSQTLLNSLHVRN